MIPVYKPFLTKKSLKYANDAISSTWISSKGEYINKCEDSLKEYLNVKNLLLTSNGTVATHLISLALQFKHPNVKKIITSNNSYVAAVNSFLYDKKYSIDLIDANLETWNLNSEELIKKYSSELHTATLIVHNMGNIINVINLKKNMKNMIFVEDACEAFSGKYENSYAGTESFASSFSFFGNKTITCGEGGAVIINDDETFEYIKSIYSQGITTNNKKFLHTNLGYNYRMTNVQAAILLGQIESLKEILEKKNKIFELYKKELSNFGIEQKCENNTLHSNWMYGIRIKGSNSYEENDLFFKDKKIEIRPMFRSLNEHPYLKDHNVNFCDDLNSKLIHNEAIVLPSYPSLTKEELKYIIKNVKNFSKGKST